MKYRSIILVAAAIAMLNAVTIAQTSEPAKQQPPKPSASVKLPTVKEVLERHVNALGGREAIEKLKTRTATGTVELSPMNLKGTFETYAAPEARSYTKMSLAGIGDLIESSDGKSAWSVNPLQGNREKTGAELAQAKLTNDFYRDLRLDKLYPKMEMKGIEKVGDKDAYAIVATAEGVPSETWYFDVKSGLLVRSDVTRLSPEGPQPMSVYYEDMRPVDGVLVPHRIRSEAASFTIIVNITEIKHGTAIDETKFGKPKQ